MIRKLEEDVIIGEEFYSLAFDLNKEFTHEAIAFRGTNLTILLRRVFNAKEKELYFQLENFQEDLVDVSLAFKIKFEGNFLRLDLDKRQEPYSYLVTAFNDVFVTVIQ